MRETAADFWGISGEKRGEEQVSGLEKTRCPACIRIVKTILLAFVLFCGGGMSVEQVPLFSPLVEAEEG